MFIIELCHSIPSFKRYQGSIFKSQMLILAIVYLSKSLSLFSLKMQKIRSNSVSIKVYFVESQIISEKLYRISSKNYTKKQSHFQKTIQKDLRTM